MPGTENNLGLLHRHESLTQNLSLSFYCSPTSEGVTLECCGSPVVEACAANPNCDDLGLTGSCCPTVDDVYLDCCSVLPDNCVEGASGDSSSADCIIQSAAEYVAGQNAKSQSSTRQHFLWTLSLVVLAVWSVASS